MGKDGWWIRKPPGTQEGIKEYNEKLVCEQGIGESWGMDKEVPRNLRKNEKEMNMS